MNIKLVEYGPFGCRLERGTIENMEDIPDGYDVVKVEIDEDVTVYLDPIKEIIMDEIREEIKRKHVKGD